MEQNLWFSAANGQSKPDDFQFHLGEQTDPDISDFDEHVSRAGFKTFIRLIFCLNNSGIVAADGA
jgi:hypothetical protein